MLEQIVRTNLLYKEMLIKMEFKELMDDQVEKLHKFLKFIFTSLHLKKSPN